MPDPRGGRTANSSGTVTDPIHCDPSEIIADEVDDHDVLRDVLGGFCNSSGAALQRQRAFDGAGDHPVSGPSQEEFG